MVEWRFLVLLVLIGRTSAEPEIRDLKGTADFKEVYLSWSSDLDNDKNTKFDVQHCENLPWGQYNCQGKAISFSSGLFREVTAQPDVFKYGTVVGGLRMATSYTFKVAPGTKTSSRSSSGAQSISNEIALTTKGFSAQATKCEANFTDVKVDTGPYFGGRISVENTTSSDCAIQGDQKSPQKSYILRINHHECHSDVTSNSVSTFILVQENNSILTHSMGRFMVICRFDFQDVFTVKASVNMPSEVRKGKKLDELLIGAEYNKKEKYEILSKKNYLERKAEASQVSSGKKEDTQAAQLVLMVILVVAAVVGFSATIWCFVTSSRIRHKRGFLDPQLEVEQASSENQENAVREASEVATVEIIDPDVTAVSLINVRRIEDCRQIEV